MSSSSGRNKTIRAWSADFLFSYKKPLQSRNGREIGNKLSHERRHSLRERCFFFSILILSLRSVSISSATAIAFLYWRQVVNGNTCNSSSFSKSPIPFLAFFTRERYACFSVAFKKRIYMSLIERKEKIKIGSGERMTGFSKKSDVFFMPFSAHRHER